MAEGFGVDMWCLDSIVPGKLARGRVRLVQALRHRLITPRGTLRGGEAEQAYGLGLTGLVGQVGYDRTNALQSMIQAELKKDDRVQDVQVQVVKAPAGAGEQTLHITIDVTPKDDSGDFAFTLSVNDVTAELLGYQDAP